MPFAPLQMPLMLSVDGGRSVRALGFFYDEGDDGRPDEGRLVYLVSFEDEPRPRLVDHDKVIGQRLGR